jgi:hypothetical protein
MFFAWVSGFFFKYVMNSVELGLHGDPSVLRLIKKNMEKSPEYLVRQSLQPPSIY